MLKKASSCYLKSVELFKIRMHYLFRCLGGDMHICCGRFCRSHRLVSSQLLHRLFERLWFRRYCSSCALSTSKFVAYVSSHCLQVQLVAVNEIQLFFR